MFPIFNPHLQNLRNQLQTNGANASAPQQQINDDGRNNDENGRNNNWGYSQNKNFNGNYKHNESERGSFNGKFHHRQNTHGKSKFNNENRGKGNAKLKGRTLTYAIPLRKLKMEQGEKEIQQWCEDRKKNYPSKSNVEKKLIKNPEQPEATDDEVSKIRRQQLKEILAKQAELGRKVAYIPSCYLSDTEQRANGIRQHVKVVGKRRRFQNKFKKGKFQQRERFPKRQRHENSHSPGLANGYTKEPSLLTKLPSSEIKKDEKHPLQVFRPLEKEIQQWRDDRKKNYPSKGNVERKLKNNPEQPEATDDEVSKIRRQHLKEILAKQAELGCKVAEIPSCYLSDTEQGANGSRQNGKFGKRGRFHKKFDKKGKIQQRERFPKRQRHENSHSPGLASGYTKEPSLLKKLPSSEIKKDKKHPLQVFRPLVLNYPDKEIQQWREEHKTNHPSKSNVERKLKKIPEQPEATEDEVSMIRDNEKPLKIPTSYRRGIK